MMSVVGYLQVVLFSKQSVKLKRGLLLNVGTCEAYAPVYPLNIVFDIVPSEALFSFQLITIIFFFSYM